jgi:hypothetical protein
LRYVGEPVAFVVAETAAFLTEFERWPQLPTLLNK